MAERIQIRQEAIARQGSVIKQRRNRYLIEGDQRKARFQMGEEGLVHYAVEESSGTKYRIKCFWEPDDSRLERSRFLVKQGLADLKKTSADVLAGAPFGLIDSIGGLSRFALVMKTVEGMSWKDLRQDAEQSGEYPPPTWPSLRIRLLWAYGLACAVERMEARNFVHADLSDGNIVVVPSGERAGDMALVDFDAYFNPVHSSNYRGTSGFVAPEIWDRGSIGIGSDRVAMAILIQDLLVAGDPSITAGEAFDAKYTQDQICSHQSPPRALLKTRYPRVAELLEATLLARTREQRPEPGLWREALLDLYRQQGRRCRLDSAPENPMLRIWSSVPRQDLSNTPFGIRADLLQARDGEFHIQVHPGAKVRIKLSEGTWRELSGGQDVTIASQAMLFEPGAKLPCRLTLEEPAGTATSLFPESFETAEESDPETIRIWLQNLLKQTSRDQVVYFLLGFLVIVVLLLLTRFLG
jgi:hypothetical protein